MPSLLSIIQQLEDPDVRLEDNSDYQVDRISLGILYAHAVNTVSTSQSPSRAIKRFGELEPDYEWILKKKFQHHTRKVLTDALANLSLRNYTTEMLIDEIPKNDYDSTVFKEGTAEQVVMSLAEQGDFLKIGNRLMLAAMACQEDATRRGNPSNYPLRKEYDQVAEVFLDL